MVELPLIFLSGLLGSSHCLGMCGPFAAILGGNTNSWLQNLTWQGTYSAGRIFTYATLGAMAGYGGQRLIGLKLLGMNVTALLAIAAGLILLREGLATAGIWKRRINVGQICPDAGILRTSLRQKSLMAIFVSGIATGFLPCGLVYAFLLTSARSSSLPMGSLVMICFGLGTVPMMVFAGVSISAIPLQWRKRLFAAAGWCVVSMGLISLYRGSAFLFVSDPVACPFCS